MCIHNIQVVILSIKLMKLYIHLHTKLAEHRGLQERLAAGSAQVLQVGHPGQQRGPARLPCPGPFWRPGPAAPGASKPDTESSTNTLMSKHKYLDRRTWIAWIARKDNFEHEQLSKL